MADVPIDVIPNNPDPSDGALVYVLEGENDTHTTVAQLRTSMNKAFATRWLVDIQGVPTSSERYWVAANPLEVGGLGSWRVFDWDSDTSTATTVRLLQEGDFVSDALLGKMLRIRFNSVLNDLEYLQAEEQPTTAPEWGPVPRCYLEGSLVREGGVLYEAIQDVPFGAGSGNGPSIETAFWRPVSTDANALHPRGDYNSGFDYFVNDQVEIGTPLVSYRCILDNGNADPKDPATEPTYWKRMTDDGVTKQDVANITQSIPLNSTSETLYPSAKAVYDFAAIAVAGLMKIMSDIDCSTNPNYPSALIGHTYYVTVAGKIGGASGINVDIGDAIVCKVDNAGGTQAAVGTSWFILEHNLQGALLAALNLSDVPDKAAARLNLSVPSLDDTASDASTGVIFHGGMTVNADTSKFNHGVIKGWIWTEATAVAPASRVYVEKAAATAVALNYTPTGAVTFVAINAAGAYTMQATAFTAAQRNTLLILGQLTHLTFAPTPVITFAGTRPNLANRTATRLDLLMMNLGFFNISGNKFTPTTGGVTLQMEKSAGSMNSMGGNYSTDPNSPDAVPLISVDPITFQMVNQAGVVSLSSTVDSANYDLAGVQTAVPTNNFQVRRVFLFSSNNVAMHYGQATYSTKAAAELAVKNGTDPFVPLASVAAFGLLRAFVIIREGTTDLNDTTDCLILEADKFGGTGSAGAGSETEASIYLGVGNSGADITGAYSVSVGAGTLNDSGKMLNISGGSSKTISIDAATLHAAAIATGANNRFACSWNNAGAGVVTFAASGAGSPTIVQMNGAAGLTAGVNRGGTIVVISATLIQVYGTL